MLAHFLTKQLFKALQQPSVLLKVDAPIYTIVAANDALLKASNKSLECELVGKSLFEVFPDNPDDASANGVSILSNSLLKTLTTGTVQELPCQKYDIPIPDANKFETRYWQAKNTPIFNDAGSVEYILHTTEDITQTILLQQKEQEIEILVAQKKIILEHTESTIEIGNWSLDLNTGDFFWSPELFKICGFQANIFTPSIEKALAIIHPEDAEKVRIAYNKTVKDGHPWHIEFRIIRPDGIVILVLVTGIAIKNSNGETLKLTGLLQNITSNKQLETMLRQTVTELKVSEQKYKQLFENNPSPMFIWDFKTLQIIDCNEEALQLYGYTKDEFLDLTIRDLRPNEYQQEIDTINESDESYHKIGKRVWQHFRKDGSTIHVFIVGHLIEYKGRKASLVCLSDVTEKIKVEQALQASETKYKSFFNNSLDANLLSIENGKILAANPVACDTFGYTEEEFCQLTRRDIADVTDRRLLKLLTDKEITGHGESIHRFFKKDGEVFEAYVSSTVYSDINGEKRNAVIIKDINEKLKAEQALRENEEKYRSLFNNNIDATILASPDGKIYAANPAACKMFGYTEEEICQGGREKIIDTSDPRFIQLLAERQAKGSAQTNLRCIRKNGDFFESETSSIIYKDVSGQKQNIVTIRDISEKIKAEQALKDSETRYKSFFENGINANFISHPNGDIIVANQKACEMFGYSVEEFCQMNRAQLADMQDPRLIKLIKEKESTGNAAGIHRMFHKNGQAFDAYISSKIYHDADGKEKHAITIQDLSEQQKAEQALIESDKKYRLLFYKSPIPKWIYDTATLKIVDVNEVAIDHYGYTREEFLNLTLEDLRPKDEVPKLKTIINNKNRPKGLYKAGTFIHKKRNGTLISVEISSIPIEYEGKQCKLIIANDVTDIEYALKELALSIERYNYVTKATSDAIWDWDLTSSKAIWGEGFESIFGYNVSDINTDISFLVNNIHPDDKQRINDEFYKILKSNIKQWKEEYRFKKADGSYAFVINKVFLIRDTNQRVIRIVGGMRDITEQKEHVTEIIKAIIKTQEDERLEIGSELHDNICQILATCKISFKMLEKNIADIDKAWFEQGIEQINLVFKEVRNLSHRLAPNFFKDDTLEDSLKKLVGTFNIEDQYTITFAFDDNFKSHSISREFQLNIYRILQEQMRNILKYAEGKNIEISGKCTTSSLQLIIKDDGVGFNPDNIKSGIGLANMKRRVELFGGRLFIDSAIGKGCCITVDIPLTEIN